MFGLILPVAKVPWLFLGVQYIPGPVVGAAPWCLQTGRRPWPATAPSSRGGGESGRWRREEVQVKNMLEGRGRMMSHMKEDCGEVGSAAGTLDLCLNIWYGN